MGELPFEERLLAAICHLSVVIYLIGVIVPIIVYATQKEKSRFLRFQSLQAAVFQMIILMLFMVGMMFYMGSFLLMFLSSMLSVAAEPLNDSLPIFVLLPFIVFLAVFALYPISFLYGLYAAYKTYKGRDFRYVAIGGRLARELRVGAQSDVVQGVQ